MGTTNGIGQSLVALFRALGPGLITPLLSWGFKNNSLKLIEHFFLISQLNSIPFGFSFTILFGWNRVCSPFPSFLENG